MPLAEVSTALPPSIKRAPSATCKASAADNTCAVLDTKNVALRAKLVGLEDKIKLLEATLTPAKGAVAATLEAAAVVKAPPAPVAVLVKPKKHKPAAPAPKASSTPWLWIGVAAALGLAAIGAIVFLLLRRRGKKLPAVPAAPKPPGWMAAVKARLARKKAASAVEPVTEASA